MSQGIAGSMYRTHPDESEDSDDSEDEQFCRTFAEVLFDPRVCSNCFRFNRDQIYGYQVSPSTVAKVDDQIDFETFVASDEWRKIRRFLPQDSQTTLDVRGEAAQSHEAQVCRCGASYNSMRVRPVPKDRFRRMIGHLVHTLRELDIDFDSRQLRDEAMRQKRDPDKQFADDLILSDALQNARSD